MENPTSKKDTIKSFNGWAKTYDQNILHPLFFRRVQKRIGNFIGHQDNKNILDIGCGTGSFLIKEAQKNLNSQYKGIDISKEMISVARNKSESIGNLEFKVGDFRDLNLKNESLDYITSTFSFHHWQEQKNSLKEIYNLLKKQGKFIITDVNHFGGPGTNKIVRPKAMKKLFIETGFDKVYQISSTNSGKFGFLTTLVGIGLASNNLYTSDYNIPEAVCTTILIAGGIIYSIPNWLSKITIGEKL